MPITEFIVTETYATTTPESAADGDFADTGWINKDGRRFNTLFEVAEYLNDRGAWYPSSTSIDRYTWFSTEADIDYRTGEETVYSFHLYQDGSRMHPADIAQVWADVKRLRFKGIEAAV